MHTPSPLASKRVSVNPAQAILQLSIMSHMNAWWAISHLEELQKQCTILDLYRTLFPIEYTASHKPLYQHDDSNHAAPRIEEFLALITEHLFPLGYWEIEQVFECFPYIPLDPCWSPADRDFTDADPLPLRILADISRAYDYEQDLGELVSELPLSIRHHIQIPDDRLDHIQTHWKAFETLCENEGYPLNKVPTVLEMMGRETGNVWIDHDPNSGMGIELTWCLDDIQWLASQWQEATARIGEFNEILNEFTKDPELWIAFFRLWNHCLQQHLPEHL